MITVRKRAGASEDRLEIRIAEVLSDVTHEHGLARTGAGAQEGRRRVAPTGTARRRAPTGAARGCGSCGASGRPTSGPSTWCAMTALGPGSRSRSSGSEVLTPSSSLDPLSRADPHRLGLRILPRSARRPGDQAPSPGPRRPRAGSTGSRSTSRCSAASASPSYGCSRRERCRPRARVTRGRAVVLRERRDRVLVITINRPDQRNAVNAAVASGIAQALDELDATAP